MLVALIAMGTYPNVCMHKVSDFTEKKSFKLKYCYHVFVLLRFYVKSNLALFFEHISFKKCLNVPKIKIQNL